MTAYPLDLGCTRWRHEQLGVNAAVNARGGDQHLNDLTQEDVEMMRDAQAIRDRLKHRVRWYGPNSRFFRRNRARVAHLISRRDD